MRPSCEAVLFDFDGVLIDSEPVHYRCWRDVLATLGVPLAWDTYRDHFIGISDRTMAEAVASLSAGQLTADAVMAQYPAKKALFRAAMADSVPVADDIPALLEALSGFRLAVVSSSFRAEVEPVLVRTGLRRYFQTIVCGDDVRRHKPDPEPYLLAARHLAIEHALVVEDSEAGAAAGAAAGFSVVRVGHPGEVARRVRAALGLA